MQGQEFDSSTFHHFFLSGVLRVLRGRGGAKNNNAFDDDHKYIYSYILRKRSERFFFFRVVVTNSFSSKSPFP